MPMIDDHIRALKDEAPRVRQVAASALGNIGDPVGVDPLIEALKDGDVMVRKTASEALERLEAWGIAVAKPPSSASQADPMPIWLDPLGDGLRWKR